MLLTIFDWHWYTLFNLLDCSVKNRFWICLTTFHLAHHCLLLIPMYTLVQVNIINPSENVLDLGINMSKNCSFDVHINILCKECTDLLWWILRTFTSRDSTTLMTLFKALILSRFDYFSQLWSPHLIKHIMQIEKVHTVVVNGFDWLVKETTIFPVWPEMLCTAESCSWTFPSECLPFWRIMKICIYHSRLLLI